MEKLAQHVYEQFCLETVNRISLPWIQLPPMVRIAWRNVVLTVRANALPK